MYSAVWSYMRHKNSRQCWQFREQFEAVAGTCARGARHWLRQRFCIKWV